MQSETISLQVDAEAARAYSEAREDNRRKLQLLLNLRLRDLTSRPPRSLQEVMEEMGSTAEARGLTPEILRELIIVVQ